MEVSMSFSNDMDDEYEKLCRRMNPPRVVIDNEACKKATVIRLFASAYCAGALDVTDDLQNLLDGDELTGLHCFHHEGPRGGEEDIHPLFCFYRDST